MPQKLEQPSYRNNPFPQLEVIVRTTQSLMGSALVGASSLLFSPAVVEPLSEKIERLERQTELLQKQLQELQSEITQTKQTKKKSEKKETELAKRSEPSVDSSEAEPPPYVPTEAEIIRGTQPAVPGPVAKFGGVQLSAWGWLEAATVFREHNSA